MKEIGGYFGLEKLISRPYYPDLIAVNTARNAMLYILLARKAQKLFIPSFLCNSVSDVLDRENICYEKYSIGPDFLPVFDRELDKGEFLYVVNYYGQIDPERVKALKMRYGNIILDNVQAFFQKPVYGVDTVYSCRKFFGVPDGAYAATDARTSNQLLRDVSMNRMKHVLGRFEGACASDFYGEYKANNRILKDLPLQGMSALSENLLGAIDYDKVLNKRNENFSVLAQCLGGKNPLKVQTPNGAFAYPFYCRNGMKLKKRLAQEGVYVPTLWPNVLQEGNALDRDYAENILPLPCDQRYDRYDMETVSNTLRRILDTQEEY